MRLNKAIKLKAKQIEKDEQSKYKKRTENVDRKAQALGEKAKAKNKSQNQKLIDKIKNGALVRAFWWLVQFWIEVSLIMFTMQLSAQTILPRAGVILGHAAGLTTKADIIDKVNIMFIPTGFLGLALLVFLLMLYKASWKKLTEWFGILRDRSLKKHNLKSK